MNTTQTRNSTRTYSAKARAAAEGKENREAQRIERELRERISYELGEDVIHRHNTKGDPIGVEKINTAFFARLFAEKYDVLFEQQEERLYRYNADRGLWQVRAWEENIVEISRFMLAESRRDGYHEILGKRGWKLDSEIQNYLKGMVGRRGAFSKEPDSAERFIHFRNGVYVIRNGKPEGFRPDFRKEDFSRNQIPVDYVPGADCPRMIDELLRPVLNPDTAEEDMNLLFRFLGLFLLGVNLPQRMLILDGAAGSGKSTFAKLAGLLVGRENIAQLRTLQLAKQFELFAFIGKTLLLGADVSPKFLLTPGAEVLKTLVGGDFLEAEAKLGNDRVAFLGSFNVIINTNSQLRVKIEEDADAWRRRLAVVTFQSHKPAIRIPSFERVLFEQEGSGIVNRALQGLHELLDAGGSMSMTQSQLQRVDVLLERSEPIGEFLRDRVIKRDGASLAKKRIRERFKDYCKERRWSLPTDREIGSKLPDLMREIFAVAESNNVADPDGLVGNVMGYRGVDWSND